MSAARTRAVASETGESPFAVRIEVGNHTIAGDETIQAGGEDSGPSPFDLLTASLAECTAMTLRWYARQKDLPLEHVEVVVDHVRRAVAESGEISDVFEKTILIRGPRLTQEQRIRLLDIADRCPVHRALSGSPSISTRMGTPLGATFDF
jgi:putative redox protein